MDQDRLLIEFRRRSMTAMHDTMTGERREAIVQHLAADMCFAALCGKYVGAANWRVPE